MESKPIRVSITIPAEDEEDFKAVCKLQTRSYRNFVVNATLSEIRKNVKRYQNNGNLQIARGNT